MAPLHKERRHDRQVKLSPSITSQSSFVEEPWRQDPSLPVSVTVAVNQVRCVACHVLAASVTGTLPQDTNTCGDGLKSQVTQARGGDLPACEPHRYDTTVTAPKQRYKWNSRLEQTFVQESPCRLYKKCQLLTLFSLTFYLTRIIASFLDTKVVFSLRIKSIVKLLAAGEKIFLQGHGGKKTKGILTKLFLCCSKFTKYANLLKCNKHPSHSHHNPAVFIEPLQTVVELLPLQKGRPRVLSHFCVSVCVWMANCSFWRGSSFIWVYGVNVKSIEEQAATTEAIWMQVSFVLRMTKWICQNKQGLKLGKGQGFIKHTS